MRALPLAFSALMLLAACSGGGGEIVTRPVSAAFVEAPADGAAGNEAAEIEVNVEDRQPVETVALVAPDGGTVPAYRIERNTLVERSAREPSFGVGVFAGSSGHVGTSIGIDVPVGRSGAPHDPRIESRALVRVPDMEAYRAGWPDWKLRITLGTSGTDRRVMEIPAPRPPEG